MVGPAVELDDELLVSPERVDKEALDEHVQLRPRDAVVVAEVEEVPLPVGVGEGRGAAEVHERSSQRL
jgi:hypothetical protein